MYYDEYKYNFKYMYMYLINEVPQITCTNRGALMGRPRPLLTRARKLNDRDNHGTYSNGETAGGCARAAPRNVRFLIRNSGRRAGAGPPGLRPPT